MDVTTKTLENTIDNIKMIESKGYVLSPISNSNGMNKAIRYSPRRRVYWFTNKWISSYIDCVLYRSQIKQINLI